MRKKQNRFFKFNKLINKKDKLDKLLDDPIKIEGVRVSKHFYADIDIVDKANYGIDWEVIKAQVLERDNYECQEDDGYCNGSLQIHHILPISKGGTNKLINLITLCKYHHSTKHDHMGNI